MAVFRRCRPVKLDMRTGVSTVCGACARGPREQDDWDQSDLESLCYELLAVMSCSLMNTSILGASHGWPGRKRSEILYQMCILIIYIQRVSLFIKDRVFPCTSTHQRAAAAASHSESLF